MSNVYNNTQASAIPQNPNHVIIRGYIRKERKYDSQKDRMLHNAFRRMPEQGVVVMTDLYRKRPDFVKFEADGFPCSYQRLLFRPEFEARLEEDMSKLSKDFVESRAGQVWWDIHFAFGINHKTGYRHDHHTARMDDIVIKLKSRRVIGRPQISYLDGHFSATLNSDEQGGCAACCLGGYKSLEDSNSIIIQKGTHVVDHEYDWDTRETVDLYHTSRETVVCTWGGTNPRKLKKMFERWLDVYRGQIYGYLCEDSRMGEEMMRDCMDW